MADQIWDDMFGVRYYSFVYRDVLFLCLNTQGGPGSKPVKLEDEQIKWALAELKKNKEVLDPCFYAPTALVNGRGNSIRDKGKRFSERRILDGSR